MPIGLGGIVAKNFKINKHHDSGDFLLKLRGDFDGSSAFELINTLKKCYGNTSKIVIDTIGIASIHPFGLDVFQKNCSILIKGQGLKFIGKYASTMATGKTKSHKCYPNMNHL
jgi:anti-anti-sigma regulatory factor